MFYDYQNKNQQNEYIELLKTVGSLSNLFAENAVPYLYYRIAENIFCRAFDAQNLSRGDVSADASKNGIGIGLKTFLHNNGKTFQKVAEFNKGASDYQGLDSRDIIESISKQRNERINFTKRAYNLNDMIYHLVTREAGAFNIYEEKMDIIDLITLKEVKRDRNIIQFSDKFHEYKFNISKKIYNKYSAAPIQSKYS